MSDKPLFPTDGSSTESTPKASVSPSTAPGATTNDQIELALGIDPSGNSVDGAVSGGAAKKEAANPPPAAEPSTGPADSVQAAVSVKRASRLRNADQATLSTEDMAWLAEYEANKRPRGRPKKSDDAGPKPPPPPIVLVQKVERGRVKSPPPVLHDEHRWLDKYSDGVNDGREMFCVFVGDKWHKALVSMAAVLIEAGEEPVVDVNNDETRRMLIVAVHQIAPPSIKATPAILGAFTTTALLTQRVAKRKKIAEAAERRKRPAVVRAIQQVTNPDIRPTEPAPIRQAPVAGPNNRGEFVMSPEAIR